MTFGPTNAHPLWIPNNDVLVIQLNIATIVVRRILWILEVSLLSSLWVALQISNMMKFYLKAIKILIIEFDRQATYPLRTKKLLV